MKKLLIFLACIVFLSGCSSVSYSESAIILPLFSSSSQAQDKMWIGTFQLVFNDFKNHIIKHDIEFINEKPTEELKGLNNEEFDSSMLNDTSYYTSYGITTPKAKEEIKKGIKEKFNETSDILDSADWSEGQGKYYAYAMLKKQFEFIHEFDKLGLDKFNNSQKEYQYFGINGDSKDILYNNVRVLFYNNENDYAVGLITKNGDIVYLYRNDKNDSLKNLYDKMLDEMGKYEGSSHFTDIDTLKIPNIKFQKMREFEELCNKPIKGTDLFISQAIETLQFELDNKGGTVKSEALMMADNSAVMMKKNPRHFEFNKTFNMFLIDSGKKEPYMALRIFNLDNFVQE